MSYFEETFDLEVKEKVLKVYGKTFESLKKDVENVRVWLKTQPHLPQVLAERQIETFIILCKCNIEKAKPKIDMYFTMRTRFPDVFKDSNPFCERMKQVKNFMYSIPLPKLTSDLSRLVVLKVKPMDNPADLDPYACLAYTLNIVEIRFFEDICSSHTILFDLEHVKLAHVMKMTPMFVKTGFIIIEKVLTTRVNAIHLINAPNFIDQTLLLIKSLIKPKIAERFIVHRDADSAVKSIEKKILPRDYGGHEKSLDELEAALWKKIEEYKDLFYQRDEWKVDEDLRPEKQKFDDFFGCHGNFKKLDID